MGLHHSNLNPFIEIFSFHNAGKTQHVLIDLRSSAGGRFEKMWVQTLIEELNLSPPTVGIKIMYRVSTIQISGGEGKCNPALPVQPGLRT